MLYYSVYDMTTGTGAKYLGTVLAKDRNDGARIVKEVLDKDKADIMLQVTIVEWYKKQPIR